MSLPLLIAGVTKALSVVSTVAAPASALLSVASQASAFGQASAAAKAQNISNQNVAEMARRDMISDGDKINERQQQETAAATQQQIQHQDSATRAIATAKVGASAGGVTGFSVDALLGDLYGQHAANRDTINQNLEYTSDQLDAEREALGTNHQRTVGSLTPAQKPNALSYGLKAGLGVVDAYKNRLKVGKGTAKGK